MQQNSSTGQAAQQGSRAPENAATDSGLTWREPEDVADLLGEIESVTEANSWSLTNAQVFAHVDGTFEDFARFLYRRNLGETPDEEFGPENVEQLVAFLEACGYADAGEQFRAAGVHYSGKVLLDWLEFFQSVTTSRLLSRPVDRELLQIAVSGAQRFESAADFYCRASFDHEELTKFATSAYLQHRALPGHTMSRSLLLKFLDEQLRLRLLRWEDLEQALHEVLHERAVEWGLAQPSAPHLDGGRLTDEQLAALRELEFPQSALPTKEKLRRRYRELLRRHHPDVNPQGLERTRTLIEAYGVLVRLTAGRAKAATEPPRRDAGARSGAETTRSTA